MNFKKCIIFIVITVFLFSIASVSAADMNETATTSTDEYEIELSQNDEKEITGQNENTELQNGNTGTFTELQDSINNNYGKTITLNKSYECEDGFSSGGIVINGPITIDGQGNTIDAQGKARIFHVKSENVIIKNIIFKNGNATGYGGAIYFEKPGAAINCTFSGNTARFGGAMHAGGMYDVFAINCIFTDNHASSNGGAMGGGGSAVNCTFTGNTAIESVGAMSGFAVNCTFTGNTANQDGGVMNWGSAVNCTFTGNTAQRIGGAMMMGSVVNCTFNNNKAITGKDIYKGFYANCYGSDDYYDSSPLKLSFNMDDYISTYSPNNRLKINLINQKGNPVGFIDVEVIIYKNDAEFLRVPCLSGFDLNLDLAAGNYTAQLKVIDPTLNASSKNITLTINKAPTTIEVQSYDTTYPGDVVITVKSDVAGLYVVKVGDVSQNVTLKANNATNITFTGLSANEDGYIINVNSENYTGFNDTVKVFVAKATPKIEVQSYDTTYPGDVVITVKSDVAGLYVVKVGDMTQNVTLEAGVEQNVTFTGLPINEDGYVVNVTNTDLENCTQSVNDTNIVKVMRPHSYINTDGLITVYNSGGVLFVSLTGIDGEPLAGRGIKVNITGKTYTIITNASGVAGLPINLKAGLHPAYVWFNGDATYAPSENLSTSVEVYTDSRITGNKDLVKRQGGSEPFKVRALDKYGKPVGAYAKVKMTVAGKTYTVFTDAKGYASLPINLKVGKYKIITSYGGTTVTNTITVKK